MEREAAKEKRRQKQKHTPAIKLGPEEWDVIGGERKADSDDSDGEIFPSGPDIGPVAPGDMVFASPSPSPAPSGGSLPGQEDETTGQADAQAQAPKAKAALMFMPRALRLKK